jgi:hypothetical protein
VRVRRDRDEIALVAAQRRPAATDAFLLPQEDSPQSAKADMTGEWTDPADAPGVPDCEDRARLM